MVAIERKELVKGAKALNDSGLAKFPVDTKQNIDSLISDFMSMVETVPVEKEDELPDFVSDLYNSIADNKALSSGDFDIADIALEARKKDKERQMETTVAEELIEDPNMEFEKETVTPTVETTVETPVVKDTVKVNKKESKAKPQNALGVRLGTKADMAIDFVKTNPGATMYQIKQQGWNDKNDTYYNLFGDLIKEGKMRKEGKGYFIV